MQLEYDNKKEVGYVDPRADDRALAHELPPTPNDNHLENEFKRLTDELDSLKVHLEGLKTRKKNIQIIND